MNKTNEGIMLWCFGGQQTPFIASRALKLFCTTYTVYSYCESSSNPSGSALPSLLALDTISTPILGLVVIIWLELLSCIGNFPSYLELPIKPAYLLQRQLFNPTLYGAHVAYSSHYQIERLAEMDSRLPRATERSISAKHASQNKKSNFGI